jgi:hypothetical protein
MHFIGVSAPLALDSTVRDRRFVAQDYTRGGRASQFEIFIPSIRFSDATLVLASGMFEFLDWGTVDFVHLTGQRIMPSGQRLGLAIVDSQTELQP